MMNISESERLYLKNYYLLEETLKETNRFLYDLATRFSSIIEEYNNHQTHSYVNFKTNLQKGGGY